jgi:hypothetical protein
MDVLYIITAQVEGTIRHWSAARVKTADASDGQELIPMERETTDRVGGCLSEMRRRDSWRPSIVDAGEGDEHC